MCKEECSGGGEQKCGSHNFGRTIIKVLLAVLLVYLIIYVGALTSNKLREFKFIGRAPGLPTNLTVDGEGKVTVVPNVATVSVGVISEKPSVSAAQEENSQKMNKFLAELKRLEIADQDIQTAQYNIYPKYDYTDGKSRLVGYTVSQNVTVKIRDLSKVDQVLDQVGKFELNQVGGLSFIVDDPEALRAQARVLALANVQQKAIVLARQLGVRLVRLVSYYETPSSPPPIYFDNRALGLSVGGAAPEAPAIQPGSQEVTVNVSAVYEVE